MRKGKIRGNEKLRGKKEKEKSRKGGRSSGGEGEGEDGMGGHERKSEPGGKGRVKKSDAQAPSSQLKTEESTSSRRGGEQGGCSLR